LQDYARYACIAHAVLVPAAALLFLQEALLDAIEDPVQTVLASYEFGVDEILFRVRLVLISSKKFWVLAHHFTE
jgi:hypothetical protein